MLLNNPRDLDSEALAHSQKVLAALRSEITAQGPISFARYMEQALYAPELGYYSVGNYKIGVGGDFITAPEISPLFSKSLTAQIHQVLRQFNGGDILELGAG